MKAIFESFLEYARGRSIARLFLDFFLFVVVITWLSVIVVFTTNFSTFKAVWEAYLVQGGAIDIRQVTLMNDSINRVLEGIQEHTHARRVALSRFHNGKRDVSGLHFVFSSRTNEVVTPGVSSAIDRRQDVPIGAWGSYVDTWMAHKCVVTTKITDKDPHYQMAKEVGSTSGMRCPVFDSNSNLIGFIRIGYVGLLMPSDGSSISDYTIFLNDAATRIGGILSSAPK